MRGSRETRGASLKVAMVQAEVRIVLHCKREMPTLSSVRMARCMGAHDFLSFVMPTSGSLTQSSHIQRTESGRWEGQIKGHDDCGAGDIEEEA